MNRFNRHKFSLRAGNGDDNDEDEEQLYERQALIYDDDIDDICDDEINTGQVVIRHRQLSDKNGRHLDNSNGYELRNINSKPYRDLNNGTSAIEFIFYDIQPGDSLQSICLRYACPVNQVKRLNGLMSDQDFHGLRRLKLPLGKLGLLEDVLKQQQNESQDLLMPDDTRGNQSRPRSVNSPGSAFSVVSRNSNPRFKPLLSPGYSSDKIYESDKSENYHRDAIDPTSHQVLLQHNSHSFSSLREFASDTNANYYDPMLTNIRNHSSPTEHIKSQMQLPLQSFIKSDIAPDTSNVRIDDLITDEPPVVPNVFEDLDYHVERARVAAKSYEQRAADLVNGMVDVTVNVVSQTGRAAPRMSRIPELFCSTEISDKTILRLVVLVCAVCIVIPIIYMSQSVDFKW